MEKSREGETRDPSRYEWEVDHIEDLKTPEGVPYSGFRQKGYFRFYNTNEYDVNQVVRAVSSEVPVMAIDLVDIDTNYSSLFDDTLAFIIGLIPLKSTTVDKFVYPEECNCRGACPHCSVRLDMTVLCDRDLCPLLSGSLKSEDFDVVPIDDEIQIVTLAAAQSVVLTAYARKGTALRNPKWQAGIAAYFRPIPDISNAYMLIFESVGQLPIEDVLRRGLDAIRTRR